MKFYFCEKCGKRITEIDIEQGAGKDKALNGVFCSDCSVGVMTMELPAITEKDLQPDSNTEVLRGTPGPQKAPTAQIPKISTRSHEKTEAPPSSRL